MVLLAGGGLILNALLGIINERGWYRWWLIYALALLDVLLVAVLVVWFVPLGERVGQDSDEERHDGAAVPDPHHAHRQTPLICAPAGRYPRRRARRARRPRRA